MVSCPRRTRNALLGVAIVLALSHPAAASGRTCNLVVDPVGDDSVAGHDRGVLSTKSLDLVSADVATTASHVLVVVRVTRLSALEPAAVTGLGYQLDTSVGRLGLSFLAQRTPAEQRFRVYVTGLPGNGLDPGAKHVGEADGVFDESTGEIRMAVPLAMLRPWLTIRRGDAFTRTSLTSYREVGSPNHVFPARTASSADMAKSTGVYRAGTRSCAAPP